MTDNFELQNCECGRIHKAQLDTVKIQHGAILSLPEYVRRYGSRHPFLLADLNTYAAAGRKVFETLKNAGLNVSCYIYADKRIEPDAMAVGNAVMHFPRSCDLIIAVGSGVINDIGKILSSISGRRYIIVATAPSMDGYASATSSMIRDGLKISLDTRCADVIIGDLDILKDAPIAMLKSGLGDMLAKYISLAEWKISHIINGEYYCPKVSAMVSKALQKCVDHAEGLLKREDEAVEAVFEGLVVGGIAMAYAGVSRPASGVEHYFSHIWDMRGLEFGTPIAFHGIQCAMATRVAARLYHILAQWKPDRMKADRVVKDFSYPVWADQLREFLGRSAEPMIALEAEEQKYSISSHSKRFSIIQKNWEEIVRIIQNEIPSENEICRILKAIDISADLQTIGVDREQTVMTFCATKDIRDKYVLSRLAWDMGVLDDLCQFI